MNKRLMFMVLLVGTMAYVTTFVDRFTWPVIMPVASKFLGLNNAQSGSFLSFFYAGYILTQLPAGLLVDRLGYRRVLLWSLLCLTVTTSCMMLIQNYTQGLIVQFLMGISSGAEFAACLRAIYEWFPVKGRTTAVGVFMTGSSFGLAIVNLYAPAVTNVYGWKAAFLVSAMFPLVCLLLAYIWIRTPPAEPGSETVVKPIARQPVSFWQDILVLLRNRNLMIVGISGFCAMSATLGAKIWANNFLVKGLHISLVDAGVFVSLFGVGAIVSKTLAGVIADVTGIRKHILGFWMVLSMVPVIVIYGMNTNITMLWILTPLLGLCASLFTTIFTALACEVVEPRYMGSSVGLANTMWQLGTMVTSFTTGLVMDLTGSYALGFMSLAIAPAIGAPLLLLMRMEKKKDEVVNG